MYTAQLPSTTGPWVIRYPRGKGSTPEWRTPMQAITVGTGRKLSSGNHICVLSLGPVGVTVEKAINSAGEKLEGQVAHYDMRFVKPLDEEIMREVAAAGYKQIITVEDGSLQGGFGSAVAEWLADHGCPPPLHRLGLPDHFVEHGSAKDLYRLTGLDEDSIAKTITANL